MAEGGVDFTICSVCLDTFKTPRILPCGNSFCSDCLETLLNSGTSNCPDCRKDIPDQSIDDFPINYVVVSVVGSSTDQMKQPSTAKIEKTDNCVTHNLLKLTFCRGPNCMVAICLKCWTTDHLKPPHAVVPLEEELDLMRTDVAKNTDAVVDFQSSVKSLMEKLSEANLKGAELLEGTDLLVAYQLQVPSEESILRLKSYKDEMLKLCQNKQTEMQTLKELFTILSVSATEGEKQLKDLISMVQNDKQPTTLSAGKPMPETVREPGLPVVRPVTISEQNLFIT